MKANIENIENILNEMTFSIISLNTRDG